jgi:hypothetical protein
MLGETMNKIPIVKRFSDSLLSDWVKAMALCMGGPAFVIYVICSWFNQKVRVYLPFTKDVRGAEEKLRVTKVVSLQIEAIAAWRWTSVCICATWLSLLYFIFSVGVGKFVNVFLSFLNDQLQELSKSASSEEQAVMWITGIFFLVGWTMFMLPPVPGVPVYFTGGIVLVANSRKLFGFQGAIVYTILICWLIKLTAIIGQQKGIGEPLGNKLWVKKLVSVNSITMKAIRYILTRPGLTVGKVSILCGGPDWPTSVTTGILKLSVVSMLIGSLPVVFLVAPCVIAGACMLRSSEGGIWPSLVGIALSGSAFAQCVAMIGALYFIEDTSSMEEEELLKYENDPEVEAAEKAAALKRERERIFTDWHKAVPLPMKLNLIMAVVLSAGASYAFNFLGGSCFIPFQVTDSIEEKLGNSALNMILPMGRFAVLALVVSYINLQVFSFWKKSKLKAAVASEIVPEGDQLL